VLAFPACRVGREDSDQARIWFPVVPGEALAAGIQPSHGSDPTPLDGRHGPRGDERAVGAAAGRAGTNAL